MNENIDLTKILKDCPKGWKLYSTIYGDVTFLGIENGSEYPVKFSFINKNNSEKYSRVTKQGLHVRYSNGECSLFPSKDQRDWSKFTAPWYKKEMDTIARIEKQGEPNPYSGVSFKYNGHTWGMCARDNGVEILVDGEIKERILLLDNKPQGKQTNEREWLYLVSDVLTWKDGIGQYLDDPRVQELAKRLCSEYVQKLYNPSNTGKNEQKPADKIEPRFKVGDWVVYDNNSVYQVKEIEYIIDAIPRYELKNTDGDKLSIPFTSDYILKNWTIQDAKDGDVLVNGSNIFIFHFINNRRLMGYCHVNMDDGYFYNDIGRNECFCTIDAPVTPSTKEQRGLLFQKIKETGYKWNTETNTFEKLVEPKFDPKTLKPFDKVLVKDFDETSYWTCNLFSHYNKNKGFYYCSSVPFDVCIPYNDDTKHLVGTTDEAPEFYRYWED